MNHSFVIFQNGEIVDFESQSIYVNCDGDSTGVDFGLEIDGIDFNDFKDLTTPPPKANLRSTLMNTVLKPGENPFKALGISGVRKGKTFIKVITCANTYSHLLLSSLTRLTSKTRFQERAAITKPDVFMALYADDNLAGNWSNFLYGTEVNLSCLEFKLVDLFLTLC